MREILFRGKRVDNGEWVYGFYFEEIGSFIKEKSGSISTKTHLVVPESVGQYIGLTDRNGIQIFEGDIVAYRENRAVIKAEIDNCGCCHDVYGFSTETANVGLYDCVVIGDIYNNPELLEEDEQE